MYIWQQGAPLPVGLGYGLANLGYLLLAATLFGNFQVFGLKKRSRILVAAFFFWVLGSLVASVAMWLGEGGHRFWAFLVVPVTFGILWAAAAINGREKVYVLGVVLILVAKMISRLQ